MQVNLDRLGHCFLLTQGKRYPPGFSTCYIVALKVKILFKKLLPLFFLNSVQRRNFGCSTEKIGQCNREEEKMPAWNQGPCFVLQFPSLGLNEGGWLSAVKIRNEDGIFSGCRRYPFAVSISAWKMNAVFKTEVCVCHSSWNQMKTTGLASLQIRSISVSHSIERGFISLAPSFFLFSFFVSNLTDFDI